MTILTYPTSAELRQVDQQLLPTLVYDDPIFDMFPMKESDADLLIWQQRDNYRGLMQVRGINGAPPVVKMVGANEYVMKPSVFGEFMPIDEAEITRRRAWGSFNQPIDISDIVRERQDLILNRQINRVRWILWTLLATGTFQVLDAKGVIVAADSYTPRVYTSAVPWATALTATPLADFRAVKLFARGYSMNFGAGSRAYMNAQTILYLLGNTNPVDLYGRRTSGLATLNTLTLINQLIMGEGLPEIVEWDAGYFDENNNFQLFIPNNKVIIAAKRENNAALGEFRMTRNVNNPGSAPGAYSKVIDEGMFKVPRQIQVHRGFNGGPALFFPSAIITMNV